MYEPPSEPPEGAVHDWDQLYEVIGRIVVTINTCHWCVFEVMGIVLNLSREETTPLYYSLKADSAQRDLTLAVARDRLTDATEAPLLSRLAEAINDLGKLSGTRNAFIHTHWSMLYYGNGKQRFVVEGKPHPKLNLDDPIGQADQLLHDLDAIQTRLLDLCDELEQAPSVRKLVARMGSRHR